MKDQQPKFIYTIKGIVYYTCGNRTFNDIVCSYSTLEDAQKALNDLADSVLASDKKDSAYVKESRKMVETDKQVCIVRTMTYNELEVETYCINEEVLY